MMILLSNPETLIEKLVKPILGTSIEKELINQGMRTIL